MSEKKKSHVSRDGPKLSMRISMDDRGLIDSAAAVARKSRTEFMVDSARRAAVDTLLDARAFQLDEEQTERLDELLSNPPASVEKLRRLMASRAPWEK
ncbi:DUF1778 domain-containing protein [Tateyamaria armeniaca]|uniref:DUF1778 domain-containing protein n=1 Tax=Tateyamaria armeniaca TaxID=2518930 RepID=A0ABW8UQ19_9RHOB